MGQFQAIFSGVISIFFDALIIAGVWKIFKVGEELNEIKTMLADLRREAAIGAPAAPPTLGAPLPGPISLASAEALLREVASEPGPTQPGQV